MLTSGEIVSMIGALLILLAFGYLIKRYIIEQANKEADKRVAAAKIEAEQILAEAVKKIDKSLDEAFEQLAVEVEQERTIRYRQLASEIEREYASKTGSLKHDVLAYEDYVEEQLESMSGELREKMRQAFEVERSLRESVEETASKLASLNESERLRNLANEEKKAHMIQLTTDELSDYDIMLNEILPRLKRPEIGRNLLWQEFLSKPTTEMLNRILPKTCSGIYKITSIIDNKSYIGRSVDVRARLIQHVKSSVGVGTIADQLIHGVMAKEGIVNFTFELLEECDRDKLPERERYYIATFSTKTNGYNKTDGG